MSHESRGKSQEDAIAREKYLKSGMGKRYVKNRIKRFLAESEKGL